MELCLIAHTKRLAANRQTQQSVRCNGGVDRDVGKVRDLLVNDRNDVVARHDRDSTCFPNGRQRIANGDLSAVATGLNVLDHAVDVTQGILPLGGRSTDRFV